jgi:hypothetical protein
MSKLVTISAAALAAALMLTTAPATAQRHPGPSDLRDADRQPQTAIAIPALIRSRAQAEPSAPAPEGDKAILSCRKTGGDRATSDSCSGKVKVFDGAGQPDIRAAQPEGDEAAAARMQSSNNLKQVGLANH